MTISSMTWQLELEQLLRITWMLLIPIGLLLIVLLVKVVLMLQGLSEFLVLARHEASPMLQDSREIVSHLAAMAAKARSGVEQVEKGAQVVGKGVSSLKDVPQSVGKVLGRWVSGFLKTF